MPGNPQATLGSTCAGGLPLWLNLHSGPTPIQTKSLPGSPHSSPPTHLGPPPQNRLLRRASSLAGFHSNRLPRWPNLHAGSTSTLVQSPLWPNSNPNQLPSAPPTFQTTLHPVPVPQTHTGQPQPTFRAKRLPFPSPPLHVSPSPPRNHQPQRASSLVGCHLVQPPLWSIQLPSPPSWPNAP